MTFTPDSFNRRLSRLGIKIEAGKADTSSLFCVVIDRNGSHDVMEWCAKEFGDLWIWSAPTFVEYTQLFFQDEEAALIVKLKFGRQAA